MSMSCKGKFGLNEDRVCQLCEIANNAEYKECRKMIRMKHLLDRQLHTIKENCPHYHPCCTHKRLDKNSCIVYDTYDGCTKNGMDSHRKYPTCTPCLECDPNVSS